MTSNKDFWQLSAFVGFAIQKRVIIKIKEINNIINDCLQRTRRIVNENKENLEKMALKLLDKETLDLLDIIEVLGNRKYPLPDSINDYLNEIKKRNEKEEEKRKERENLKHFEENNQNSETEPQVIPANEEVAAIQKN